MQLVDLDINIGYFLNGSPRTGVDQKELDKPLECHQLPSDFDQRLDLPQQDV